MLTSFLRPSRDSDSRPRIRRKPSPSYRQEISRASKNNRHESFASFGEEGTSSEEEQEERREGSMEETTEDAEQDDGFASIRDSEDGEQDKIPLLPIFSTYLDELPVFAITHAIRDMVVSRCETVLSWDQLRSPQVSQFLLKPIQQEIRSKYFNAATEYALIANCLQFSKEIAMYPGNSGTSKTRAMVCELLAIKTLREYSTRELIDALSYDFDPFQGQGEAATNTRPNVHHRAARISCYEVALRAQAKRFLAHPMVVQQLEAIWAGTIVFHSAADSMHRKIDRSKRLPNYGTTSPEHVSKMEVQDSPMILRRAVTLYDPRDASLFKLSRLRVPRYRNILSTMSFAVLLGLFLAVLIRRSLEITTLEVVFWFWAAGYMLDEIVGFTEQGFGLYIASFWNTFDLGILLMLFVHLCLRLYGVLMPDVRKHTIANMAYDVLAADAILLFPRLFSVLDHYRYFSQLLIAFRMMAQDLIAVFLLILISCSGFFVALSLSFGNDDVDTPSSVAYALLQMIMGFTPAAWDRWDAYNALGKTILTLFLFICHFLVVTILITVLTNSFMAIVQNANDEHQFVFAVNTISNVKSDALFSYVAPTNIIQWVLTPLRYFVSFRQYVKINRTIIKITHFPILLAIYVYERMILVASGYESVDMVERRGRTENPFSGRLVREPSVGTVRQDRALEEVFRQPYDSTWRSPEQSRSRRKASNVVSDWMKDIADEDESPPAEPDAQGAIAVDQKPTSLRMLRQRRKFRDFSGRTRSITSDPLEFTSNVDFFSPKNRSEAVTPLHVDIPSQNTDADGDDEAITNEHEDEDRATSDQRSSYLASESEMPILQPLRPLDYFTQRQSPRLRSADLPRSIASGGQTVILDEASLQGTPSQFSNGSQRRPHMRNVSSATMIYRPVVDVRTEVTSPSPTRSPVQTASQGKETGSRPRTPISKPASSVNSHQTPKRTVLGPTRMRPIFPNRDNTAFQSAPNLAGLVNVRKQAEGARRRPSLEMDLVSDIGDNKAIGGGYVGAIPASFATQIYHASTDKRQAQERKEEQDMFGRLMMARMNSLEEGFREVIHEMRESITNRSQSLRSRSRSRQRLARSAVKKSREKRKENDKGPATPTTVDRDDDALKHDGSNETRTDPSGVNQVTRANESRALSPGV